MGTLGLSAPPLVTVDTRMPDDGYRHLIVSVNGGGLGTIVLRPGEDESLLAPRMAQQPPGSVLTRDPDGTRRTDLANQVDRSDIDTEFERCGRYKGTELSGFQFPLGYQT